MTHLVRQLQACYDTRTVKARFTFLRSLFVVFIVVQSLVLGDELVRIMAGNLSSGDDQSYDPGHGIRIIQGVKPKVALLQEMNFGDNSDDAIRGFVDAAFGKEFHYYRESWKEGGIPNGIVSAYPILEKGTILDPTMGNRGFAWAKLDVPGGKKLWVYSLHLSNKHLDVREEQAQHVIDDMMKRVPEGDYVAIGGDFNTRKRDESPIMIFKRKLSDKLTPADQSGNTNTNGPRNKPFDWVMPNDLLQKHHVCVEIIEGLGGQKIRFPNGAVIDTRVFKPVAAIHPARVDDSGASNMQHMAIVQDYLIP